MQIVWKEIPTTSTATAIGRGRDNFSVDILPYPRDTLLGARIVAEKRAYSQLAKTLGSIGAIPEADLSALALLLVVYPFFFAVASYWWARAFGASTWVSAALLLAAIVLAGLGNLYVLPQVTRLFI